MYYSQPAIHLSNLLYQASGNDNRARQHIHDTESSPDPHRL